MIKQILANTLLLLLLLLLLFQKSATTTKQHWVLILNDLINLDVSMSDQKWIFDNQFI